MALNMDELSLMAFASEEVIETWRQEVLNVERAKEQRLISTRHTNTTHLNVYSQTPHTNTYSQTSGYSYHTNYGGTGTHTDVAARNSHSDNHTNTYDQRGNTHTDTHRNSYDKRGNTHTDTHRNSYDKRGNTHTDTHRNYSTRGHSDSHRNYSQSTHSNTLRTSHTNRRRYGNGTGYAAYPHNNRYSQSGYSKNGSRHTNSGYSNSSGRTNHTNTGYNEYAKGSGYTKSGYDEYSKGTGYTKSGYDEYSKGVGYTKSGYTQYSDSPHSNTYSQSTHVNYSATTSGSDYYSERAHRNSYSESAAVNKGFDHENYIPSAPEVMGIEGAVLSESLDVILASYDKNNDGVGSQDQNSKDIYYIVKIRQIQDLAGSAVSDSWHTLQDGAMTDEFTADISGYADGIYELSTQAYNLPRTENGVTKEYVSDEKVFTFTISAGEVGSDLTILNSNEFFDYAYGLETVVDRESSIKRYADSILYAKGGEQQKGLFLEIALEDEDTDTYHKVKVGLEKGSTVIAENYDLIFETNADGSPKPGDKTGVVFIPLDDMLDNGSFSDVRISLHTTEYEDAEMTVQKGETVKSVGMTAAKDVVYIDTDPYRPTVNMTDPATAPVTAQSINLEFEDSGLGVKERYYQVVDHGDTISESDWVKIDENSFNFVMNVKGAYDVYAKVIDNAGNETVTSKNNYVIKESEISLRVPDSIKQGDSFTAVGTVVTGKEISKTKFWIQGYGDDVTGEKSSSSNDGPVTTTDYNGKIKTPDNIPAGTHVVFFEVTYEDGTTQTVSETITVLRAPLHTNVDIPGVITVNKKKGTQVDIPGVITVNKKNAANIDVPGDITVNAKDIHIKAPKTVLIDSKFTVKGDVTTSKDIASTRFWIDNPGDNGEKKGKLMEKTPLDTTFKYDYSARMKLPKGVTPNETGYKLYFEVTFRDGTKRTAETTIMVVSSITVDEGPRYIDKNNKDTLIDNSKWKTDEEYRKALEDSLENTTPKKIDEIKN